ncbi:hypothetical protein C446_10185 [Halobiforma nitratireducens JCM 10879]|uniref:Uncharacterized protein n=1 Tax=Halobiforma nitratireducens JCM 10879 TaxID=1227454 RepID=M0M1E0_9EURY|nr:hypothetical protein C446_10185 [Halobiforma nitratireducens JCM 10879]
MFDLKRTYAFTVTGVVVLGFVLLVVGTSAAAATDLECTNSGAPGETCIYEPSDPVVDDGMDTEADADAVMTAPEVQECREDVDCEEIIRSMPDLQNFAGQYEFHYANQYQYCVEQQSP